MDATSLFKENRLVEAIEKLGSELRKQPSDTKLRTFLFELLCFAGQYDRAEKQLEVLGANAGAPELGVAHYNGLLRAQRSREEFFARIQGLPVETDETLRGSVNGRNFDSCTDEDLRIGACLEIFTNGAYNQIPFHTIERMETSEPQRLRDLLWLPARLLTRGAHTLEVHIPILAPFTWKHPDEAVRLGRLSVMESNDEGLVLPFGSKIFLFGDDEVPLLEIRSLVFAE